ncbi:MAG: hypothetical protein IAE65_09150 [Ignavibacteria bacterium]|nr:hypothetical protein [Ignavibacteria bacterium]
MSHSIYFYFDKESIAKESDIIELLDITISEKSEDGEHWTYINERTGVYFIVEKMKKVEDVNKNLLNSINKEYKFTGFCFILNYYRADFFGYEAFSFIEYFTEKLNLNVLDPQEENIKVKKYNYIELFKNWSNSNNNFIKSSPNEENFFYPTDKSEYVWKYNFEYNQLENTLDETVFIPRINFVKNYKDNSIGSICIWYFDAFQIFPNCDYYLLGRFLDSEQKEAEYKVIKQETLFKLLNKYFIKQNYLDIEYFAIPLELLEKLNEKFLKIESELVFRNEIEFVREDLIINI